MNEKKAKRLGAIIDILILVVAVAAGYLVSKQVFDGNKIAELIIIVAVYFGLYFLVMWLIRLQNKKK